MTVIVFLRCALLIPPIAPLGVFAIAPDSILGGVLFFSIAFGGAAYVLWTFWAWRALGGVRSENDLGRLFLVAPLVFVPIQATTWIAYCALDSTAQFTAINVLEPLLPFGVYSLFLGYAYGGLVWCAYRFALRAGLVTAVEAQKALGSNAA